MRRYRPLAALIAALVTIGAAPPVAAAPRTGAPPGTTLERWLERNAVPVPRHGAGADLTGLGRLTRGATVVGLGEAAHGLAEVTDQKSRAVRYLVAERGYRTIAWEDDWTLGIEINDYVQGRRHDRDALIGQLSREARTREVATLLTWLREYNRTHREKVTFVGTEYFATRPLAYDAVRDHVAATAPDRLTALQPILDLIRPPNHDIGAHLTWFRTQVRDKAPYVQATDDLYDLVEALPHRPGDRLYALALQHARQIRSFYTGFSLPDGDVPAYRDARAAENVRWWQQFSGDRVMYWAAAAHTTAAPEVTITAEPYPATRFTPVGFYLDRWYGRRYVTVGYTFDAGTMFVPPAQQVTVPPAPPEWFEAPLARVDRSRFYLDLTGPVPTAVHDWLSRPTRTRGFPELGTASTATGGTPRRWYDALIHLQTVSASTPVCCTDR